MRNAPVITNDRDVLGLCFPSRNFWIGRAGNGEDARAEEVVEASIDGDDIEIAFNPGYLQDGLASIDAATAQFAFTQATRPAVITGMLDGTSVEEYRYLLMPVRLTG